MSGFICGVAVTASLSLSQFAVLYMHPAHTFTTIALQLCAMALICGLWFLLLKWRKLI